MIRPSRGEVETKISSLGTICHKAHPPNCTLRDVELPHSWAKVKKPPKLVIETRDKKGNRCRGREKVLAVLRPVTAGVPVFGKVTDKRDGTYEVHFKSVPSLECMLSVTIGGHHVVGSPVEVKVAKPLDIKKMNKIQKEIKIGGACYAVACGSDGMLYAAKYNTKEILVINRAGQIARRFKHGCDHVNGITFSKSGNIVTSDFSNHVIKIYTPTGQLVRQFGGEGSKQGQLGDPTGVAVNEEGHLFIAESGNHRISVFTENGQFLRCFGSYGIGAGCFKFPWQLCISPDGLVYISDNINHCIKVHGQDGR